MWRICIPSVGFIIRIKGFIENIRSCKWTQGINETCHKLMISLNEECNLKCHPECKEDLFEFTAAEKEEESKRVKAEGGTNFSFINVKHKPAPHTIIIHVPEMTWTAFCANIGGLAGIWLGLNAVTVYDYLVAFIKFIKQKLYF